MKRAPLAQARALSFPTNAFAARLALALVFLALLFKAAPAGAEPYKLGPMDKLTIRVVEWQTAEGTFREWPTITGDYTIGPAGLLSLPFAGEIKATGRTTSEIASEIATNIQQKFGLVNLPEASVQITEFRPIFVSGDVQTPGKYPFDPEMTVLKAVSLAGGMHRSTEGGQRYARDFLNARGNYDVLISQQSRLIAKRARLQAELDKSETIKIPDELSENKDAKKLIGEEAAIMQSRDKLIRLQLNALDELKTLFENEISSLEKKSAVQNRQMELARKELNSIGNLADRGLVVNSRVLALENSVADMEGKLLDLDTASLRAKQEISKAARDSIDLQNDRDARLATEGQAVASDLESVALKMAMYRDLMTEALTNAPDAALIGADGSDTPSMQYSIVRTENGKTSEIPANESTPVLPGDLVKVSVVAVRS
ncbi:MAG: polysaccharide biosynthesis/export family protein [Phyllobacterium sp.]